MGRVLRGESGFGGHFRNNYGRHCFSWIGGMKVSEDDNKGITELHYVEIENGPPKIVIELIDDEMEKNGN